MENCHFFREQMMSMASIVLVEVEAHRRDITNQDHMMIELEIILHLYDHMMIVDGPTLCHQGIYLKYTRTDFE